MKKFKFRLERVLQQRQAVRDECKRELMLKNQKLQEARDRLAWLQKIFLSNGLEQQKIMNVNLVFLAGLFSAKTQDDIEKQRLVIKQAEDEVAKAMEAYIAASKDARSLEMLRERKLQQYVEYVQKEDEKFLDELAVQRSHRSIE